MPDSGDEYERSQRHAFKNELWEQRLIIARMDGRLHNIERRINEMAPIVDRLSDNEVTAAAVRKALKESGEALAENTRRGWGAFERTLITCAVVSATILQLIGVVYR